MSKANILVDLYNLELSRQPITGKGINAPPEDRQAIIEFLETHAPKVTTFKTAEELDAALNEKKILDAFDMIGSLGFYEQQRGQSWFDANVANFYIWLKMTRKILDTYLSGTPLPSSLLMWAESLLKNVHLRIAIVDKEGRRYSAGNAPKELDQEEYSFAMDIGITTGSVSSDNSKTELGFGRMHYNLFGAILSLWNGEVKIERCALDGCPNIYIARASGKPGKYCSGACKAKAYRMRKKMAEQLV